MELLGHENATRRPGRVSVERQSWMRAETRREGIYKPYPFDV